MPAHVQHSAPVSARAGESWGRMGGGGVIGGRTVRRRDVREEGLMVVELFIQLLILRFLFLPPRAEPQTQGNSQVLLDAPIQLSKITENYGESEGRLN